MTEEKAEPAGIEPGNCGFRKRENFGLLLCSQ